MVDKFEKFFVIITAIFVGILLFNNFSGINSSALIISLLVIYFLLLIIRDIVKKKNKK
ncbi:hypothetical protein [Staphylococcus shinii]|uniref:hypothetical protein n=1 Tax=Staphylococcus shinii TaxID=2912228 RepID=UPI0013048998|nr:hypothetical protein [Staphylococcus shinii]QRA18131.1 hypothetical protein JMB28_14340 [Staphylococcus shinii]